jgi:hypothetical protein
MPITKTNSSLLDRIADIGFKFFCLLFPALILYITFTDGNGCGDLPRDYIFYRIACIAAFCIAFIWSLLDKQEKQYVKLKYWLQIAVRYFLAYTIMQYGAAKVVDMQFASSISGLDTRVVDLSPMRLAWTFFGFSYGYEFFIGCGQIIAAILLLHRKTATLGAVLMVTIMANIVFVNFSFNVCVKFFSTTYLVMSVFLLLDDARRLGKFFIFNQTVEPRIYPQLFSGKRAQRFFNLAGILAFVIIVFYPLYDTYQTALKSKVGQHSAVYGVWIVDSLHTSSSLLNNQITTDTSGWKRIIFDDFDNAIVKSWKKTRAYFQYEVDSVKHTIHMQSTYPDSSIVVKVNYHLSKDTLTLQGMYNADTLFAKMALQRKYFIRK